MSATMTTQNIAVSPSNFGGTSGAPIGGTSGNPGSNVLSLNLGGSNFNYDLGPDTSTMADSAYSFLDNSFSSDAELLGNTIAGSQSFLAGLAAPALAAVPTEEQFNTQVLPSMFQSLNTENYSLGQEAIGVEGQEAQASIASSSATAATASSGGGGCYITSAVCETLGEPDNGKTLTLLRSFRDSYMMATRRRRAMVALYYRTAPAIVASIRARCTARECFEGLFTRYIVPARDAIERGDYLGAYAIYVCMVRTLAAER
jgi:hypothetical protein